MAEQIVVESTVFLMMSVDFMKMAVEFKEFFGLDPAKTFPALRIAETALCKVDNKFELSIISDKEWNQKDSVQAYYKHYKNKHEIAIKESVYYKALDGDCNAQYSIAHEVAHWGLLNFFEMNFGLTHEVPVDPTAKKLLTEVHENITDLFTALLVFGEEEFNYGITARDIEYLEFKSKNQFYFARYYYQNKEKLAEKFLNKTVARFSESQKVKVRRIG